MVLAPRGNGQGQRSGRRHRAALGAMAVAIGMGAAALLRFGSGQNRFGGVRSMARIRERLDRFARPCFGIGIRGALVLFTLAMLALKA